MCYISDKFAKWVIYQRFIKLTILFINTYQIVNMTPNIMILIYLVFRLSFLLSFAGFNILSKPA